MTNSNLKCHIQNIHFKMQRNFVMQYSCVQHNIVHIEWSTYYVHSLTTGKIC